MEHPSLLAIAGIHATILSIIAAAVGITVSLIGGKKLDIIRDVLEDQRRIEAMFPLGNGLLIPSNDPKFNTDDDSVRTEALSKIQEAAFAVPCLPPEQCPSPADWGAVAFPRLVTLVHHYPFSRRHLLNSAGKIRGNRLSSLNSQSTASYRKWYEDVRQVLGVMDLVTQPTSTLLGKISAYHVSLGHPRGKERESTLSEMRTKIIGLEEKLKSFTDQRGPEKEALQHKIRVEKEMLRDLESMTPQIYEDLALAILNRFETARQHLEASSSFRLLDQYDRMDKPELKMIILLALVITFLLGIALPMIQPILPQCCGTGFIYVTYVIIPLLGHIVSAVCAYLLAEF